MPTPTSAGSRKSCGPSPTGLPRRRSAKRKRAGSRRGKVCNCRVACLFREDAVATVRDISYEVDGRRMVGRLGVPDRPGPRPAVLVAHEANGLDDFQKSRAGQLAELGYVAFALDYHGDGTPPDFADAQARTAELWGDADRMRALAQAGLDVLLAEPTADPGRVAAIGYCFGGALMLELGRSGADLKAIVGFHPGLRTTRPEDSRNIAGTVLVCVGADDPYVTIDDRAGFEAEM